MRNVDGLDGFVWAIGVIEDRFDPLFMGRCKVRYFHHNTESKEELPTEMLPWSFPTLPLNHGTNCVGPAEGDWVVSFFLDGINMQQPVMLATWPGIPELPANPERGFFDPRPDSLLIGHKVPRDPLPPLQHDDGSGTEWEEISPKSRFPEERFLKESRFSRLGRNEFIEDTIIQQKRDNILIGQVDIPTANHIPGTGTDEASPGGLYSEPETGYNAKYPYNKVYQSEGGHFVEFDDTPGAERIHIYHRIGSFIEIHPTGMKVTKNVQDDFEITLKNKYEHIEASRQETVDWFKKTYVNKDKLPGFNYDQTVGAGGNFNITTEDGKVNVYSNGDINVYTTKDAYLETEGNLNFHVHKDWNVIVDGNYNLKIGGNRVETVGGIAITTALAISSVASTVITNSATLNISNTAPIISNNCFLASNTAQLLGITEDSSGDLTPPGPPGVMPIKSVADASAIIASAQSLSSDSLLSVFSSLATMIPGTEEITAIIENPLNVVPSYEEILTEINPNLIPNADSVTNFLSDIGGIDGLTTLANTLGGIPQASALISAIGSANFSSFLNTIGGINGLTGMIGGVGSFSSLLSFVNNCTGNLNPVISSLGNIQGIISTIEQLGSVNNVISLVKNIGAKYFPEVISAIGGIEAIVKSLPTIGGIKNFLTVTQSLTGTNLTSVISAIGGIENIGSLISQFGSAENVGDFLNVLGGKNVQSLLNTIGGITEISNLISAIGTATDVIYLIKGIGGGDAFNIALQTLGGVEGIDKLIKKVGGVENARIMLSGIYGGKGSSLIIN